MIVGKGSLAIAVMDTWRRSTDMSSGTYAPENWYHLGGCDVDAQHPDAEFGLVRCDHRDRISAGNALDDAFLNALGFYGGRGCSG